MFADTGSRRVGGADMAKTALDIGAEIIRLENLPLDQLREEWRRLHQTPPPKRLSRDILLRGSPMEARVISSEVLMPHGTVNSGAA